MVRETIGDEEKGLGEGPDGGRLVMARGEMKGERINAEGSKL